MIFKVRSIFTIYIISSTIIQNFIVYILNTILPQIHNLRICIQRGDKLKGHFRIRTVGCDTSIIKTYVCS